MRFTTGRDHGEPTGVTMTDLVAVVAGSALAFASGWYSELPQLRTLGGRPAPSWFVASIYLQEILHKGCLAMIPVILARRIRYGGPIRPAEFLALTVGLENLLLGMQSWPVLGLVYPTPEKNVTYLINIEAYDVWMLSRFTVGVAAALIVVKFRRRMAAWVVDLLVGIAWVNLAMVEYFVSHWLNALAEHFQSTLVTNVIIGFFAKSLPFGVISWLPMISAVIDWGRYGRRGRSWVEWSCLGIGVVWRAIIEFRNIARAFASVGPSSLWFVHHMVWADSIPAVAIGVAIVRRFGPVWRRWLGREDRQAL